MARERVPAFQFYPKDFLSDGNQAGMSLQEAGAYIRLMSICWLECSLPDDVARCARMVGATPATMRRMWPALRSCFRPHLDEAGRLVHPRLEKERQAQEDWRQKRKGWGKLGGRPPVENFPNASFQHVENSTFPHVDESSPIPTPTPEDQKPKSTAAARRRVEIDEGTYGLYCVIAREARDLSVSEDQSDSIGNVVEHFKSLCARRNLVYDTGDAAKAIEAVMRPDERKTA